MDLPNSNEQLFRSDEDWQFNACVNSYRPTLGMVAAGYKEGADALANATAERNATLDLAIYPNVFLYRQYLELKIKEIIETSRKLESEKGTYPTHHDLKNLWAEALRLLKQHYGTDLPVQLANIQCCIDEFQFHDPNSMAFRYPADKNGHAQLQELRHINLRNLYEAMGRIANLLDGFTSDLSERLQCLYEMRADYANDCPY